MHIEQQSVFLFKFPYDGAEIMIPVREQTREGAIRKLQHWMSEVQKELALESPQIFPTTDAEPIIQKSTYTPGAIPDDVLELRIDTLMGNLGAGSLTPDAKAQTIKHWTGHNFNPKNYTKIITELELISAGEKEIPKK